MRQRARIIGAIAWLYIALCYLFILLPVVILVLFSFQDGRIPVPPFHGPTLKWYAALFADDELMSAFGNSVLVGVASSAISVVLGFLAAYGVSRHKFSGQNLLRGIILLPLAVSYLLIGMGLLITMSALGIGPALWLVVIGHAVINIPLAFSICLAQLGEHQRKIEWAARDLGAGTFRVLTRITVPVIAPALIAAFCLCFTLSWDEFLISFLLTRFDVTLPVVIWSLLRGGVSPQLNAAGALIFGISIVLVLLVEALLFRKRQS